MACESAAPKIEPTLSEDSPASRATPNKRQILVALMLPQLMVVINLAMINVALPAIRDTFNAPADLMAWVVTIYSLPYVALMPLYGRLGDELGIRRMMLVGAAVFLVGTAINALSQDLPLLLLGRFVQGLGASGMVPLAIAMISRVFSVKTRGRALGQWNSVGPLAGITGTLLGGVIIDTLGWRTAFFMPLLAGFVTIYMVRRAVRAPASPMQPEALRDFDWIGVLLLSATLTALLFYITSRPITGRPSLTDWRLLLATVVLLIMFVWHERRITTTAPFIDLTILADGTFRKACIAAATRMFVMSGSAFLIPLFLADIKALNATATGLIFMLRAVALFPTMYIGGRITDRWGSRLPIALGLSVQAASIGLLILSGTDKGLFWVVTGLIINGLGAGVALPALHHAAMSNQEGERGGAAAGLYSMIRYWGMMLGTALAGVLLQYLLDLGIAPLTSYRFAYASTIIVGIIGVATAFTLPGKGN
jgi:DHA2 family methylenomycin A resistance protein-like MFS transporter